MHDILDVLKGRRSVRKYKEEPVPEDLMEEIIQAGLYAPTGMNRQETLILKITEPSAVRELGQINGKLMGREGFDGFYGAPAVLCIFSKRGARTGIHDGCSVLSNMMNEAASLGLGTCWIHRGKEQFETPEGKELLKKSGIDGDAYECVDSVVVGFPEGEIPPAGPRKEGRVFSI